MRNLPFFLVSVIALAACGPSDGKGDTDTVEICPGDADSDGDGVCDSDDLCADGDDTVDLDGDGVADDCDPCPSDVADDSDGDGVCDSDDICAGFDDDADGDGDGQPNDCDPCPQDNPDDSDGDGVCDEDDRCVGDDATGDSDSDGVCDSDDACPLDALDDSDGDGVCDSDDVCPGFDDAIDFDGDGVAEGCDCDDLDPAIFPGAVELCDGLDNDCNGAADFPVPGQPPPLPDYTMLHSNDPSGPVFAPAVMAAPNGIQLGDDDVSNPIPIGFTFTFYEVDYANLQVSSNGFVRFGGGLTDNGCCSGDPIPTVDTINNIVAMWWEDLNPSAGGSVGYETQGAPGAQVFLLEFSGVPLFGGVAGNYFQLKLFEATGAIELHYTDTDAGGGPYTVGVEDDAGLTATAYLSAAAPLAPEVATALRFEPFVPFTEGDADGDGHFECDDCDDSDPTVHPGLLDICDTVDNDCDLDIDEDSSDTDGDGVCDALDPCPNDDPDDIDNDGYCGGIDPCPGIGDADVDAVCDPDDICPGFDDTIDTDADGVPDGCDICPLDSPDDTDGDGVCDSDDPCPLDSPDDTDGDGVCDSDDPCPLDNPDDTDGDGVCDAMDLCPGFDDAVDSDSDSSPDGCDCDDVDPLTYPGAPELCDGLDNDCSGFAYSYSMLHSSDPSGPVFAPLVLAAPTPIPLTDDSVSGVIPLGFTFNFYGVPYTDLEVASNGLVGFGGGFGAGFLTGCCTGLAIPTPDAYDNIIAMWWEDLNPTGSTVQYETQGSPGSQVFLLEFVAVPLFFGVADNTFQLILYEATGVIEIHYTTTDFDAGLWTVGVEDAAGAVATAYLSNAPPAGPEIATALRFTPTGGNNETDADGDGYLACEECDDADTYIYPGARDDQCDGVDDDCDLVADQDALDTDLDGVCDLLDPCPLDNPDDPDNDGLCGSLCLGLGDADGDGVCDPDDICVGYDDNLDIDGDGVPDDCDVCPFDDPDDSDGDGVCDTDDPCPNDVNDLCLNDWVFANYTPMPTIFDSAVQYTGTVDCPTTCAWDGRTAVGARFVCNRWDGGSGEGCDATNHGLYGNADCGWMVRDLVELTENGDTLDCTTTSILDCVYGSCTELTGWHAIECQCQ